MQLKASLGSEWVRCLWMMIIIQMAIVINTVKRVFMDVGQSELINHHKSEAPLSEALTRERTSDRNVSASKVT